MTSRQICQLGFECPYHRISEDGDEICIYPYIRITEREEDETFSFPEESDCPLMDYESPLENWRMNYEEDVNE